MLFYLLFNVGSRCHRIGTFGLPLEWSTGVMFFLSNGDAGHSLNLKASNWISRIFKSCVLENKTNKNFVFKNKCNWTSILGQPPLLSEKIRNDRTPPPPECGRLKWMPPQDHRTAWRGLFATYTTCLKQSNMLVDSWQVIDCMVVPRGRVWNEFVIWE